MRKKMILLVAGALAALAFTALAGTATAKETKLKCEGAGFCKFTAGGGFTSFSIVGGDTVNCETSSGSGEMTGLNAERESSTGTIQFLFKNCKEQNTAFHFSCTNTETPGNVTTNVMTFHNIAAPEIGFETRVLFTSTNMTFNCAGGFARTQFTGSIIGEYGTKCNSNTGGIMSILFSTTGDGAQARTTYTGSTFRLEGKTSHSDQISAYASAAQSGIVGLTFDQSVILTCA
jgi:hypothetical protein